jgi:hypothetical protein
MAPRVILLQAAAPPKPAAGAPCNGCGVCCATEPCPLGMWLSRRRQGRCVALQWAGESAVYRCGALVEPTRWLPWLPAAWARALVRRWIAAASGCDADLEAAVSTAAPGQP